MKILFGSLLNADRKSRRTVIGPAFPVISLSWLYASFSCISERSSSIYFFGIHRCDTRADITSWRPITAALFVLIFFHQKPRLFMIFRRLELPRRKLMESLSLTRNAEIVGSLFLDIIVMNSSSDDTVAKTAVMHYMFSRIPYASLIHLHFFSPNFKWFCHSCYYFLKRIPIQWSNLTTLYHFVVLLLSLN
jgi:hypothetical protein